MARRSEHHALLLWRGVAGSVALAVYSLAALFAAALALAPLAGRRPAGRRVLGSAAASPDTETDRQALPG